MLAIEKRETVFSEMEMYEEHMPGATGWSLIAMAQRDAKICGGVVADAIGAGKTVISIALILQGLDVARESAKAPRKSMATLVVVPSHLIRQWESEVKRFTALKAICIYDLQSLKQLSVEEILFCDCIIVPVDILEADGYLEHLIKSSGGNVDDSVPRLPPYAGQKELNSARGVWMPMSSADPYGGANNSNNQRRRNASARYTHVYIESVHRLREKEFVLSKKGVPF